MEDINLANLSDDELDQLVTRIEANVSAMRAVQMKGLREIDRRQTPLADGCRSLVEWVTGRLDVTPDSAKEIVATARRLESAPTVEAAALDGTISFDRAAAVARLVAHEAEETVMAESAGLDVAGIHRQVALRRRMTRKQEHAGFRERYVATQSNLDHTALDFHGHLTGVASRVFEEALHTVGDQLPDTPAGRPSRTTRNADALWKMSQDALDGTTIDGAGSTHGVTVFVDAVDATATGGETGVVIESGPRVGPETLEAMICSASVEVIGVAGPALRSTSGAAAVSSRRSCAATCCTATAGCAPPMDAAPGTASKPTTSSRGASVAAPTPTTSRRCAGTTITWWSTAKDLPSILDRPPAAGDSSDRETATRPDRAPSNGEGQEAKTLCGRVGSRLQEISV